MSTTPIGLEIGSTWVFASAVDWPGWCRRGKGEGAAIAVHLEYGDPATTAWPARYFIRRSAWHVLDHAWEMEDKSRR